jgi:hypothetical protein
MTRRIRRREVETGPEEEKSEAVEAVRNRLSLIHELASSDDRADHRLSGAILMLVEECQQQLNIV